MKATNAEIEIRLSVIYDMVVKGSSRKSIVRYCAKEFEIASRQTDEYLSRVYAEIKEVYGDDYKKNIVSKQLAQLDDLYVKNYTIEDFKECRSLIESKSKLLGLNEPDKKDITLNTETNIFKSIDLDVE